jgi:hypothetical protein
MTKPQYSGATPRQSVSVYTRMSDSYGPHVRLVAAVSAGSKLLQHTALHSANAPNLFQ